MFAFFPALDFPAFRFRVFHHRDVNTLVAAFIFCPSRESVLETDTAAINFHSAIAAKTGLTITFFHSLLEKVTAPMKPPLSDSLEKDKEAQFIISKAEKWAYLFLIGSPEKVSSVHADLVSLGLKEELKSDGGTGGTSPVEASL